MTAPAYLDETPASRWRFALIGVAAGLFAGFFGVGGGIIIVPLLVAFGRASQHTAHATSLAAIFVISLSALGGYATSGEVDFGLGVALGIGGIVGSSLGASLMHRLSPTTLKLVFAGLLVVLGTRMVL